MAAFRIGRGWRGAAIGCALTIGLAACGGQSWSSSAGADGRTVVLDSVQTTAAAKTAHLSMHVGMTGLGALGEMQESSDGLVDFATGNSELSAHVDMAGAGAVMSDLSVRVVDHVLYVKIGAFGGKWLAVKAPKLTGGANPLGAVTGNSDPTQFLASLAAVSDSVENVGSESVRGVETTHYHASLDLAKVVDRAKVPPALRDSFDRMRQSMAAVPAIPVDVFVDAQGRMRRLQMTMDLSSLMPTGVSGGSGASGVSPTLTIAMDLYDFGVPVNVQAPPADEITTPEQFGSSGGGAYGSASPPAASS